MKNKAINQANQIVNNSYQKASLNSSVAVVVQHVYFDDCIAHRFDKALFGLKELLPYISSNDYSNLVQDVKNDRLSYFDIYYQDNVKKPQPNHTSCFADDLTYVCSKIFE